MLLVDHEKCRSRRGPLGDFLTARRASLDAVQAGLSHNGQKRRVPGLRREEVAQLAGISTDYYSRLEQGRVRTASRAVLHNLGRALRLNGDQHRYLLQLANHEGGHRGRRKDVDRHIRPQVARLLVNLIDTPALVFSPYLDILAWNRLASALLGNLAKKEAKHRNYVRMVFLDPHTRSLLVDWRQRAQEAVSTLRMAVGRHPAQARMRDLVDELNTCDQDFRVWWSQHLVTMRTHAQSRLNHPVAGRFSVDCQALNCVDDNGHVVVVLSAPAGSPAHDAIRRLDAWAVEHGIQHGACADREDLPI
ncbi:MAG TPA: helix-turn-helix transcriptional regulator [Nonomuraea sp.]|nr:helix-turn-helix transcriptional regulator [Nonomuraea sp.]